MKFAEKHLTEEQQHNLRDAGLNAAHPASNHFLDTELAGRAAKIAKMRGKHRADLLKIVEVLLAKVEDATNLRRCEASNLRRCEASNYRAMLNDAQTQVRHLQERNNAQASMIRRLENQPTAVAWSGIMGLEVEDPCATDGRKVTIRELCDRNVRQRNSLKELQTALTISRETAARQSTSLVELEQKVANQGKALLAQRQNAFYQNTITILNLSRALRQTQEDLGDAYVGLMQASDTIEILESRINKIVDVATGDDDEDDGGNRCGMVSIGIETPNHMDWWMPHSWGYSPKKGG